MRGLALILAALLGAAPALAEPTITTSQGTVRVLDKITGTVRDLTLTTGTSEVIGHLTITMGECRFPRDNPTGDAYVQLVIQDTRDSEPAFAGWMVASEPALEPFDHPRYDVWALSCVIPDADAPVLNLEPAPEEAPPE
ncbi:MAG: DUF2155 domain-containing protein [Rubellimicrobium sp.]|nr:DUF2155 domain-containing protein [Rubellimicrobium sp.]